MAFIICFIVVPAIFAGVYWWVGSDYRMDRKEYPRGKRTT